MVLVAKDVCVECVKSRKVMPSQKASQNSPAKPMRYVLAPLENASGAEGEAFSIRGSL